MSSCPNILRGRILNQRGILPMVCLGARAFDSIGGEEQSRRLLSCSKTPINWNRGAYIHLVGGNSEAEKMAMMTKVVSQGRIVLSGSLHPKKNFATFTDLHIEFSSGSSIIAENDRYKT